jgi:predicted nucleic acid-binding protein
MKWLLDTEIVSALSKPTRPLHLVAWVSKHADESAVSVITLGELSFGVRTAGNETARRNLDVWLGQLRRRFSDAILGIDEGTIIEWKMLLSELKLKNRTIPCEDSLIAVVARQHGLTIVFLKDKRFAHTGARLLQL